MARGCDEGHPVRPRGRGDSDQDVAVDRFRPVRNTTVDAGLGGTCSGEQVEDFVPLRSEPAPDRSGKRAPAPASAALTMSAASGMPTAALDAVAWRTLHTSSQPHAAMSRSSAAIVGCCRLASYRATTF